MSFPLIEISQCCKVINGSTPSRVKPEYWNGEIDWVTPKDLSKLDSKYFNEAPEKITELGYKSCSTTIVPVGSLLYTSRAPIGHLAITQREICTNQGFKTLVPNDNVDVEFLYYVLKKYTPNLQDLGNGATFKELSKATISSYKIPLPPIDQQKKIAAILDAADAYRQKTKALITKYEELTQSLFLDMFGDPVRNPMGWEIHSFGLLVENRDSKRIPVKSSDRDNMDSKYPYYGASRIIDYVDDFTHEGDHLLIGEDGANLLARSSPIAFIAKGQYWVNNHAHVLGYNGKVLLVFLEFFINLIDLTPYISGSAQPKLNRKNMDQIKIFCPPMMLQNQFAERIQAIEEQKAQAQASLVQAEDLFNSLLQKAFKGELV